MRLISRNKNNKSKRYEQAIIYKPQNTVNNAVSEKQITQQAAKVTGTVVDEGVSK